jgi:DNA-directed RNA polymerase subunit RPC12/RpoP
MENLSKKVGYLKGLMEGAELEADSPNGKLLAAIVDLLGDLSDRVEVMDDLMDDLNDYVESIDDDLAELEGQHDDGVAYFDEDLDDDDDEDLDFDDAYDQGEDKLHLLRADEEEAPEADDAEDDEADALAGKLCPKCERMFFTALDDDEAAEYVCPHCGERITPMPLTPDNAPIAKPVEE